MFLGMSVSLTGWAYLIRRSVKEEKQRLRALGGQPTATRRHTAANNQRLRVVRGTARPMRMPPQEQLTPEAAKVLRDNAWELYGDAPSDGDAA